jgi:hypothetical protein
MSQHFQLEGTVQLFIYRGSPHGTAANRATMAELGILLKKCSHMILLLGLPSAQKSSMT